MATKEITRAVYASLTPLLADLGFHKKKVHSFVREVASDVLGVVGFQQRTVRSTGAVMFAPYIGLRFQLVEAITSELCEDNFDRFGTRTIGPLLGYVMPENRFLEWEVKSPEQADGVALGMVERIEYYGLPYIERHKSLSDAIPEMVEESHADLVWDYRLMVSYAMLGEREKAFELIAYWRERRKGAMRPAVERLNHFVRNFEARIDSIPILDDADS